MNTTDMNARTLKTDIVLRHDFYYNDGLVSGWLDGIAEESDGRVTVMNKNGNVLFTGSASLYDKLFERG